jgi:hypothetical protein
MEIFTWKEIFAFIASMIIVLAYYPYIRDILQKKTEPHLYTWIIWALTMAIAAFGVRTGGGEQGSWALFAGVILVSTVTLLSFRYGTKNITRADGAALAVALLAAALWWGLESPVLAVLLAAGIDAVGYIPTFRKSYREPWSETLSFWVFSTIGPWLAILANTEYNFLTIFYLTVIGLLDGFLAALLIIRRRKIPQPKA